MPKKTDPTQKRNPEANKKKKSKKFNAITALRKKELFTEITIHGLEVKVSLPEEFDNEQHYALINTALCDLYRRSKPFQEKFSGTLFGRAKPLLLLKETHGYRNGKEIIQALSQFTTAEKLNIRNALISNELFMGAQMKGQVVNLQISDMYADVQLIRITKGLRCFYDTSSEFQAKFKQPIMRSAKCELELKDEYHYQTGEEVLAELARIASIKTRKKHKARDKSVNMKGASDEDSAELSSASSASNSTPSKSPTLPEKPQTPVDVAKPAGDTLGDTLERLLFPDLPSKPLLLSSGQESESPATGDAGIPFGAFPRRYYATMLEHSATGIIIHPPHPRAGKHLPMPSQPAISQQDDGTVEPSGELALDGFLGGDFDPSLIPDLSLFPPGSPFLASDGSPIFSEPLRFSGSLPAASAEVKPSFFSNEEEHSLALFDDPFGQSLRS